MSACEHKGETDRVVLLPGLLCDRTMFAQPLQAMPTALSFDDHYGGADRIEDMAEHVIAQAPAQFALIGHSMGARVALEIVARVPDRVTRLMIADTGVHGVTPEERKGRYALRDLGREQGFDRLVDRWLPPMVGDAGRSDAGLMDAFRAMCARAGQAIFEAQIEALLNRPDARRVLPLIRCPTMIVVGSDDRWAPVAQHREIESAVPGARLHIIADAGHMAPAERPDAFTRLIEEWLALPATRPN